MTKPKNTSQTVRYTIFGLLLTGTVAANFLPISARGNQFLVMIVLIWFQVFILFDVFFR